jgi:ribosome-binding protein aMBF1 (putative translation factor)
MHPDGADQQSPPAQRSSRDVSRSHKCLVTSISLMSVPLAPAVLSICKPCGRAPNLREESGSARGFGTRGRCIHRNRPNRSKVTDWSRYIKTFRARHGLSQVRLAAKLAVEETTIQRWEAGERVPPPYLKRALRDLEQELRTITKNARESGQVEKPDHC